MQKVSKGLKMIGVHPDAYEALRGLGKVNDSFAIVVDKLLEERRLYGAKLQDERTK